MNDRARSRRIVMLIAVFSALLSTLSAGAADVRFVVDTGHEGGANVLAYHTQKHLLFSGGADGTVMVWDTRRRELVYVLRVSHLPIRGLVVHPQSSHLAVLLGDGPSASESSVWNWEQGRLLHRVTFEHEPLFMAYSSRGTRLMYSTLDRQSLMIVDARNGRRLPLMRSVSGIVTYATDSVNENTIMTYEPSGSITYRAAATGAMKTPEPIQTIGDLSAMSLSSDKRILAGRSGDRLVLVDTVYGTVRGEALRPGIVATAISPRGDEIACIYREGKMRKLARYVYLADRKMLYLIQGDEYSAVRSVVYGEDLLYLAFEDGSIRAVRANGDVDEVSQDRLADITDIGISENMLVIGTVDTICVISSNFFTGKSGYFAMEKFDNPLRSPVGIDFTEEGRIVLWTKGDKPGAFAVMDPISGLVERTYAEFQAPIRHLAVFGDRILALDRSGVCRAIRSEDFSTEFQYPAPGMNKIIFARGNTIIGGRNVRADLDSALLLINSATGETVSIPDPRFLIYEVGYDSSQNALFTIGVERIDGRYVTTWKSHVGEDYRQASVIQRYEGEDLTGGLAVDVEDRRVYASLGFDRVQQWDGTRLFYLERSSHIPRDLTVAGGKLFSLNKDSTVTVWNVLTRRTLMDFYLFKDLSWLVVFRDTEYAASSQADRFLHTYLGYQSVPVLKRYYRVELSEPPPPEPEPKPPFGPDSEFDFSRERDYFELY